MDFYSTSSLKQQSMGRHVAPLGHIILIPTLRANQSLLFLLNVCFSGKAINTDLIVFVLMLFTTLEGNMLNQSNSLCFDVIYNTRGKHANHYTTNVVSIFRPILMYLALIIIICEDELSREEIMLLMDVSSWKTSIFNLKNTN